VFDFPIPAPCSCHQSGVSPALGQMSPAPMGPSLSSSHGCDVTHPRSHRQGRWCNLCQATHIGVSQMQLTSGHTDRGVTVLCHCSGVLRQTGEQGPHRMGPVSAYAVTPFPGWPHRKLERCIPKQPSAMSPEDASWGRADPPSQLLLTMMMMSGLKRP
jgi:hypothetical protein